MVKRLLSVLHTGVLSWPATGCRTGRGAHSSCCHAASAACWLECLIASHGERHDVMTTPQWLCNAHLLQVCTPASWNACLSEALIGGRATIGLCAACFALPGLQCQTVQLPVCELWQPVQEVPDAAWCAASVPWGLILLCTMVDFFWDYQAIELCIVPQHRHQPYRMDVLQSTIDMDFCMHCCGLGLPMVKCLACTSHHVAAATANWQL